MKRTVLLRVTAGLTLAALFLGLAPSVGEPRTASAHPLGNFTVSRYARIDLSAGGVALRYAIDMAEIPAFQEIQSIDQDGDRAVSAAEADAYLQRRLPDIARRLDLRLGDARIDLAAVEGASVSFPEGQGGLKTLRLVADFAALMPEGWSGGLRASFRDGNYSDRVGWKEIVIRGGDGVALLESSASAVDRSSELTAYPEDLLESPLDVREAAFAFEAGTTVAAPRTIDPPGEVKATARARELTGFARLIERQDLTPAFVALSLLAAMAWGAAHALGPGHGKTIVAAYLVGSRGTAKHALALGLTVTATHTSSVIALGLVTLYASRFVVAEDLYLWLSIASGALVVLMGLGLFWSRLRAIRRGGWLALDGDHHHTGPDHKHGGDHDHAEGHEHPHDHALQESEGCNLPDGGPHFQRHEGPRHTHSHLPTRPGWQGLVLLGVSGGLLPCPTALVVMLGAIALERIVYGLVLIVAFSFGLAAVLTGIGVLLVYAGRLMSGTSRLRDLALRFPLPARVLQVVPLVSAAIILGVGVVLTGQALSAL